MVFRGSKEFQGRLVTADLQATTDLRATRLTLMSMGTVVDLLLLLTMIHPLFLHLQV